MLIGETEDLGEAKSLEEVDQAQQPKGSSGVRRDKGFFILWFIFMYHGGFRSVFEMGYSCRASTTFRRHFRDSGASVELIILLKLKRGRSCRKASSDKGFRKIAEGCRRSTKGDGGITERVLASTYVLRPR